MKWGYLRQSSIVLVFYIEANVSGRISAVSNGKGILQYVSQNLEQCNQVDQQKALVNSSIYSAVDMRATRKCVFIINDC